MIGEQRAAIDEGASKLAASVRDAAQNNERIAQYARDAERIGQSAMLRWEAGTVDVVFGEDGDRSDWAFFDKPFAKPPIVLVADSLPHAWLLVKTDEINEKAVKWATTIVGGPRPKHHSRIQWLAVLPVDRPGAETGLGFEELQKTLNDLGRKQPHKAPEPTPAAVTSPAGAGAAPAAVAAHL